MKTDGWMPAYRVLVIYLQLNHGSLESCLKKGIIDVGVYVHNIGLLFYVNNKNT